MSAGVGREDKTLGSQPIREAPGVIPPVFPALHVWHCPQAPPLPTHLSAVNASVKQETAMVLSWIRLTMEILKRAV